MPAAAARRDGAGDDYNPSLYGLGLKTLSIDLAIKIFIFMQIEQLESRSVYKYMQVIHVKIY